MKGLMDATPLCDIIKHIQIFTSIHNNYCLTQLYFARGDMFLLLIQPSSGQLTIEQDLLCAHNMGSQTVYILSTCEINISVKIMIIYG